MLWFKSKAPEVSDIQAGAVSDMFVRAMFGSNSISAFDLDELAMAKERISTLPEKSCVDAAALLEMAKINGFQYIMLGSVTELSQSTSSGSIPIRAMPFGIIVSVNHTAKVTIEARVIDVATSEISLAFAETGTSTNLLSPIHTFPEYKMAEKTEFEELVGVATADATFRVAYRICGEIGGEYARVLSNDGGDYVIGIGSSRGVLEGMSFLVYAGGKQILDEDGGVQGTAKIPLAVLKVTRVESAARSVCTVAPPTNGSLIQRGDKIEPISAADAKNVKSPSSRPKFSYYDAFERLMGNERGAAPPDEPEALNEPNKPEPPSPSQTPEQ